MEATDVGEAGAVFGFAAFLSTRKEPVGPFGGTVENNDQLVHLIEQFNDSQGWELNEGKYPVNLRTFPS